MRTTQRTDGCFTTVAYEDEEGSKEDAGTTDGDIGDIGDGTVVPQPLYATLGIDSNRGRRGV
jgi:hypothetical protein